MIDRRHFLALAAAGAAAPALAQRVVDLGLPGGPSDRTLTSAWPGKGEMIVQRLRPPLLEAPMSVFEGALLTPNDRHYVRWHWPFPTEVDPSTFRLRVGGHVKTPLALSLADLQRLPRYEIVAVNQCAGNSRGLFQPRVAGAQWAHGAMANARWSGVRLRDVLDLAGVRAGAVQVRASGMDEPSVAGAPDFAKSLGIDHARDGEVMLAFAMNGEALPLLNGFPLRLVVPGWYATYWVKMLDSLEVLATPDTGYWMAKAYMMPANRAAHVAPGTKDFAKVPISRMVPRSFITSVADGAVVDWRAQLPVGGIAFGGDTGVARVDVSGDGGRSWVAARLGADGGRHGFRRFDGVVPAARGLAVLMAQCTNTAGEVQSMQVNWNPSGYQRGVVEVTRVRLV
nr:molybdopterin-dependent oxidoreductase [Polymorphobacter sp.]